MQAQSKRPRAIGGHVWRYDGKRGSTFYAKIRLADGTRVNRKIGPAWTGRGRPVDGHYTKRTANDQLQEWLVRLRSGEDVFGVTLHEDAGTFGAAAEGWLAWGESERGWRYSTTKDFTGTTRKWLLPAFGEQQLEEITAQMIERWRSQQLAAGMGRRTAQKVVGMIGAVFNHTIRVGDLPIANPAVKVPKLRDATYDPAAFQFYDSTEVAALLRATPNETDRALFLTAATTGLRLGELIALRVRDVDFGAQVLRVSRSYGHQGGGVVAPKSGHSRSAPLISGTAKVLARLLQRPDFVGDDDLVFAGPTGGFIDRSALRKRFKRAQSTCVCGHLLDQHAGDKHAGACTAEGCDCETHRPHLRPLRFHDLRHTFATAVAASGEVPLRELQEMLGHSNIATTMRYSHFSPRADQAGRLAKAFQVEQPEATPAGGVRSVAVWLDDDGHEVAQADATRVVITEYDGAGRRLHETWGEIRSNA